MAARDYFQSNVELWARKDPKEAVLLPYFDVKGVGPCLTELGEENLYCETPRGREYFHSQEGAVAEAKKWYAGLKSKLAQVDVVYIYGIGLGYYYDAIKSWLKKSSRRTVVFLEDDLRPIAEFLKTARAHRLLQDLQVHLVYVKKPDTIKELLGELYWNFAMTKATVTVLNYYRTAKSEMFEKVCHEVSYSSDLKMALLDEYLNFGGAYFVNLYRNILHLSQSYLGDKLFKKFARVPAIICGAGPSLEKNAPLLKQLGQRALIFSGGSSTNVLNVLGIQPHFCAGIDPNDAQQVRLRNNQAFEVPFFYRQRLNYGAFRIVHGPRLYVTGSGGYDVAEYFEERLGIEGKFFEEGHNVINFAMEIAYQMGCDPIIFVGMDLAFTDKKTYSAGVTFDPAVEQRTLDEYANYETVGLLRKDIFGEPIYTLWKWVAEAEWIGEWAKSHTECRLINCTEGGLGFPGVPNSTLVAAAKEYLREASDLQGRVHAEVQNSRMPQVTQKKVEEAMRDLRDSLVRCREDFKLMIEDIDRLKEKMQVEERVLEHTQSGRMALVELDLAEEPAYHAILEIFNTVSSHLLTRDMAMIKHGKKPKAEWRKNILRMELNQKKMVFLQDVAHVNAELIDLAFEQVGKENKAKLAPKVELMTLPPLQAAKEKSLFSKTDADKGKQGPWRTYYDSGALKSETFYQAGILEGPSVFYDESGAVLSKALFKDGKLEGELLQYYAPTAKRKRSSKGKKDAPAIYSLQHFSAGVPHGSQLYYYENGKLKTEMEYEHGRLVGDVKLYESDGKLKRICRSSPSS